MKPVGKPSRGTPPTSGRGAPPSSGRGSPPPSSKGKPPSEDDVDDMISNLTSVGGLKPLEIAGDEEEE
jgi:hypothetical protein